MKYRKVVHGIFIDRPNRFIAHVEIEGKIETVHVKNTGRCKELLIPGAIVILEDFRDLNTERKTFFDLIAVYKNSSGKKYNVTGGRFSFEDKTVTLINMDSQAPNKVVKEWLCKQNYDLIRPEYTYGNSRVDFYMEMNQGDGSLKKYLMEVKSCTLEIDGKGYFPDAPTERGVKHLHELVAASKEGINCILAFVIQIPGIKEVFPNIKTHQEFGQALEEAKDAGVEVLYLQCDVKEDELNIIN